MERGTVRETTNSVVVAVDYGATSYRVGLFEQGHGLTGRIHRAETGLQALHSLSEKREATLAQILSGVQAVCRALPELRPASVGIAFGAVVSMDGIVQNASVLWGDASTGYDLQAALKERLPGTMKLFILNDVSAASWRYQELQRFCLITVSSGLGNKVFDRNVNTESRLVIDAAGVGGEMGHVTVDAAAKRRAVATAREMAKQENERFRESRLFELCSGAVSKIDASMLGTAALAGDALALGALEREKVPVCDCGNIADLCAYSAGRGAINVAQLMARGESEAFGESILGQIVEQDAGRIDGQSIAEAARQEDAFALEVVRRACEHLAARILQLAADIGLERFVIVGGFAHGVGKHYFETLRRELVSQCYRSGFFSGWTDERVAALVEPGIADDNDGLIGMSLFMLDQMRHFRAVHKLRNQKRLVLERTAVPAIGAEEFLLEVVFAGICQTDLQLYTAQRDGDPTILGHECVARVLDTGKTVSGVTAGDWFTLNPNSPVNEYDKIGHTPYRPGFFQELVVLSKEQVELQQVSPLPQGTGCEAVLTESLACVLNAQRRVRDHIVDGTVLIMGAGLFGLLHIMLARVMGARTILLANRGKERLQRAVALGLIEPQHALIADAALCERVLRLTGGQGVNVAIVGVSMGIGVRATRQILPAMADESAIHLFGGFRSDDRFEKPDGSTAPVHEIRARGKEVTLQIDGKRTTLVGTRGCSAEHMAEAVKLATSRQIDLRRLITHVVSLDSVPQVMEELAAGHPIAGRDCIRAVIDMTLDGEVLALSEYGYRQLVAAADAKKEALPHSNLFRKIGFEGEQCRLGWVLPPSIDMVQAWLEDAATLECLADKKRVVVCTSGNVAFSLGALLKLTPCSGKEVTVCDSTDPQAILRALPPEEALGETAVIGISKSARTLEVRVIMDEIRAVFEEHGLSTNKHFLWLTQADPSREFAEDSLAQAFGVSNPAWPDANLREPSVLPGGDFEARFCAPHSSAFLLLLSLHFGTPELAVDRYREYVEQKERCVAEAIRLAEQIRTVPEGRLAIDLPGDYASALECWLLSLINESFGGKEGGSDLCVRVAEQDGFTTIRPDLFEELDSAVALMAFFYTLDLTVAIVAFLRDVDFVPHDAVREYKHRIKAFVTGEGGPALQAQPTSIGEHLADRAAFAAASNLTVVFYGSVPPAQREELLIEFGKSYPNKSVQVHSGPEWNHHSFPTALASTGEFFLLITAAPSATSEQTPQHGSRVLEAIARATAEALGARALHIRLGD
jgi:threonine dehydrogenase-like Zn-dependent dehydrogenase/predicted NBD/HSP70 family sugar kinase